MQRNSMEEFKEQCRRSLSRSVEDRMRYGFCYVYKPVLDDAPWRVFDSMAEYRKWYQENLPEYLGYGVPTADQLKVLDET